MDEKLYRQLVEVIRKYSFQILVADADIYREFTSMNGEAGDTVMVRCLALQTSYTYGKYPRGHRWYIPICDLHRAIRERSENDTDFMWRVRRCDLNRYDVERIVADASHDIIHLHMY